MSSMESLDKLQAELSGNVYGDAFHTLYNLTIDASIEHSELMAQAMKWVRKEKVEPLEAENAKLRERVAKLDELLPDNGRWFSAETVEAYVAEIAKLREYLQMAVRIIDVAVEKLGYNAHPDELEKMHKVMRELGIEATG